MSKRERSDGHLSKEEYYNNDSFGGPSSALSGSAFPKAAPDVLAARKIVLAQRNSKQHQFAKHIAALNSTFHAWFNEQFKLDPLADLTDGFQDYIDHLSVLEDRYLRTYGEVLTFGSGDCGQLAHGIEEDEDLMVKYPRVVYSLRDKKVCGIACGGIHNAVYTESGQVFTWGCNDDGSLGRIGEESMPLLVEGLSGETIIRVACGDGQTIAVSTTGDVWGWGCYKDKEGKKWFNPAADAVNPVKDIKKQQNTPQRIPGLEGIVEIACGSSFNLGLASSGVVYSWGIGECGELGRFAPALKTGSGEDCTYDMSSILKHHITPQRMFLDDLSRTKTAIVGGAMTSNVDLQLAAAVDVKSIGCGAYHSMVAVRGDLVYACGLNNYGQLGLGDSKDTDPRFYLTLVGALVGKGITQMTGGMHHSLVLSSSGRVYAFGRGDSGQLGSQDASTKNAGDFSSKPVSPALPEGTVVVGIDCGGNHNLVLTDKNEVYSWGYGDMLALGHGDEKDEILPKKLNFSKAKIRNITVTQVAGGGQHSAIIGQVTTA